MNEYLKCDHCYGRGYLFFWDRGGRLWHKDCEQCKPARDLLKKLKPPPRKISENEIEEDL